MFLFKLTDISHPNVYKIFLAMTPIEYNTEDNSETIKALTAHGYFEPVVQRAWR